MRPKQNEVDEAGEGLHGTVGVEGDVTEEVEGEASSGPPRTSLR